MKKTNELAFFGGKPLRKNNGPLWPVFSKHEELSLVKTLHSKIWWRNEGTELREFEREFSNFHDSEYGISVANGTLGLEIALLAAGIGRNDEILLPVMSFYSTAMAVINVNAIPVFTDVDPESLCVDIEDLESKINSRTKAIIPVHFAGHSSNMGEILKLARKHRLKIIEDCAHAQVAAWEKNKVGHFGAGGVFSFQNAKLMTAGEGGMILTDRKDFYEKCVYLSNCGRTDKLKTYQHVSVGTNARMTEFQGAVLLSQLSRFKKQLDVRTRNAALLRKMMAGLSGIKLMVVDKRVSSHSNYMFIFKYLKEHFAGLPLGVFLKLLLAEGIHCSTIYPPLNQLPVFKDRLFRPRFRDDEIRVMPDYKNESFGNAEESFASVVSIPHYFLLEEKLFRNIPEAIEKIRKYLRGNPQKIKSLRKLK